MSLGIEWQVLQEITIKAPTPIGHTVQRAQLDISESLSTLLTHFHKGLARLTVNSEYSESTKLAEFSAVAVMIVLQHGRLELRSNTQN